jgi:hypothetical protein
MFDVLFVAAVARNVLLYRGPMIFLAAGHGHKVDFMKIRM